MEPVILKPVQKIFFNKNGLVLFLILSLLGCGKEDGLRLNINWGTLYTSSDYSVVKSINIVLNQKQANELVLHRDFVGKERVGILNIGEQIHEYEMIKKNKSDFLITVEVVDISGKLVVKRYEHFVEPGDWNKKYVVIKTKK